MKPVAMINTVVITIASLNRFLEKKKKIAENTARAISKYILGTKMEETKSRAADITKMRIVQGSPALYKTIMKAVYTKADPVSFCKIMSRLGNNTIAPVISFVCKSLILICNVLRYLATAIQVANLANSAGCMRKKPKSYHDFAPFTSIPKNNTPTSATITIK